jgi:hypothetical protein
MKQFIIFSSFLISFMFVYLQGFAQTPNQFKKVEVERYNYKPAKEFQFIKIASTFGNSKLEDLKSLDSLKKQKNCIC